jgi:hypothetical protein
MAKFEEEEEDEAAKLTMAVGRALSARRFDETSGTLSEC